MYFLSRIMLRLRQKFYTVKMFCNGHKINKINFANDISWFVQMIFVKLTKYVFVDHKIILWQSFCDCYTPFTRYSRLSNRWQPAVSCKQTSNRLSNRLSNPFDNRLVQPCWTNSHCSFNRLSNRVVQPVWQPAVYTIQPVVKPVWQPVVSCIQTFTRLSNRFDNRLYRVNGALKYFCNRNQNWITRAVKP